MTQPIYLDYNGTTPHDPEVIAAMRPFLEVHFGNPSSSHWYGIKPKQAIETARQRVAGLLHCLPEEIFFTSGGTESNNQAIKGMARVFRDRGRHIVTSAFEHPAVLEVCRFLESEGFEIARVPVDGQGMVDPEQVRQSLRPDTILVTIMHANNEVGTVQSIAAIAELAKARGIVMHTDTAQSLLHIVSLTNKRRFFMSDYTKMWSELSLDLKGHDALLSLLGGAYTDIFLSQKNRPEGMKYFDFVMSEHARAS